MNCSNMFINQIPTKLKDILKGKEYEYIECHILDENKGKKWDEITGCCSYINGVLNSLDGNIYSLDDMYVKWEEWEAKKDKYEDVWDSEKGDVVTVKRIEKGQKCLSVWETVA